jgi:hypothetical protein
MKPITVKKGERRRVLHLVFDHIPQLVRFSAEPTGGDGGVSGTVEVAGSKWIFRKSPVSHDLGASNVLEKGWMETFYSIYVTPDQDTRLTFDSRHLRIKHLIYALIAVVILAAVAVVAVPLISAL